MTKPNRRQTNAALDIHIGSRIRLRRTLLGISQEKLGEALNLSFQQVQKYETGSNRVSAATLHTLSDLLHVPVAFFFDGWEEGRQPQTPAAEADIPGARGLLEIARLYQSMTSDQRRALLDVAKAIVHPDKIAA